MQQVQQRLSGALDACIDLGRAYADLVIASDREAAKLRGAYDMAAESRELWKQRALDAGYRPETLADQAVRADIEAGATGGDPWNPTGSDGQRATLGEAVGQALGSASMAWDNVADAGLFNDDWCRKVYDGLMAYLSDWAHDVAKQANEATAAKMQTTVVKEWSDIAYEMWALLCNSTTANLADSATWQAARDRLRDRFHAVLDALPKMPKEG